MTLKSTITCNDASSQLNAYTDGELSSAECEPIEQHLQHCSACNTAYTQRQQLLNALKSMPNLSASPMLSQRILSLRANTTANANPSASTDRSIKATTQRQKYIWFSAGAGSALAASVLLFFVTMALKPMDVSTPAMNAVIDSLHVAQNINFVVHSSRALENVRFSVMVPGNIQLKGYTGLHELAWNGKLLKGDNLLSLPVIANNATPGVLVMRVQHQGAEKEYRINVNIDAGERISALAPAISS